MCEVESADAGAGPHGERLCDLHAGVGLHVEQTPERSFLSVVRARRITRRWPDSAILLVNQILGAEMFVTTVAPFAAHFFMQPLGRGFREPICQGFSHD